MLKSRFAGIAGRDAAEIIKIIDYVMCAFTEEFDCYDHMNEQTLVIGFERLYGVFNGWKMLEKLIKESKLSYITSCVYMPWNFELDFLLNVDKYHFE